MLNTHHQANWQVIKKRKQDFIFKGSQQENLYCKEHTYKKGTKSNLKMRGKQNSTSMCIWVPTLSQLSKIMALLNN